jgi:hypothetical protein
MRGRKLIIGIGTLSTVIIVTIALLFGFAFQQLSGAHAAGTRNGFCTDNPSLSLSQSLTIGFGTSNYGKGINAQADLVTTDGSSFSQPLTIAWSGSGKSGSGSATPLSGAIPPGSAVAGDVAVPAFGTYTVTVTGSYAYPTSGTTSIACPVNLSGTVTINPPQD